MYIGARKAQLELRSVILKNNIPIKNMRDFVQNYAQKNIVYLTSILGL